MNPKPMFCPYRDCPSQQQPGSDHVVSHGRQERRFRCRVCRRTFSLRKGTPYYRLHHSEELFTRVTTLLAHGCPRPAIVAAFPLDERTVAQWAERAGEHCLRVHEATVQQGQVDLQQVQADELWAKLAGGRRWVAMAVALPSRLWLGGEVSAHRDGDLIRDLVQRVRASARECGSLVLVDGFSSYLTQFARAFREPVPRAPGQRGKTPQVLASGFQLAQVVKEYAGKRVCRVVPRVIHGSLEAITKRVQATAGQGLNPAYIERLNATFRGRIAGLVRRGRCPVRQDRTLWCALYLVGCLYNFCSPHASLRQGAPDGQRRKWEPRTPAMAAGLTDHVWSVSELLHYRVRPKPLPLPKRRNRRRRGAPSAPEARPRTGRPCSSTV